jgi:hypothetical protein
MLNPEFPLPFASRWRRGGLGKGHPSASSIRPPAATLLGIDGYEGHDRAVDDDGGMAMAGCHATKLPTYPALVAALIGCLIRRGGHEVVSVPRRRVAPIVIGARSAPCRRNDR